MSSFAGVFKDTSAGLQGSCRHKFPVLGIALDRNANIAKPAQGDYFILPRKCRLTGGDLWKKNFAQG